ncbi:MULTISPECIES: PLP-dependent aminotransferase family protein [Sphingobium]|uniref:MocR-like pyridoxine biosynthesis transcription factor PdxR n=1 Tax=Sphingobium TaxID=165695 RepID=UPI00159C1223|nr:MULTISPECIES: PLP-dependent aminotransferase family protein [unclassified Sphingobium]
MLLKTDGIGARYQQIYRALRDQILTGVLPEKARLPSTRDLSREAGVSRNTILLAYEQLLAEGYIVGEVGAGTFVSPHLPDTPLVSLVAPEESENSGHFGLSAYAIRAQVIPTPLNTQRTTRLDYNFRYGLPSVADFPFDLWRKLLTRHARNSAIESLIYGTAAGQPRLRSAIADYLRRSRGVNCTDEQVVIVNGSQQALDLIVRALIDPNDIVVAEDPHYPGAREVFLAAGARLVLGRVDEHGLCVRNLPHAARRARLAYVTPSHQFPTGAVMPLARRLELLAWARETGAYILEDDYDSEYRYDSRPVEAVQGLDRHGHVIYAGTMSKTFFPGLRVGYLVLPPALIDVVKTLKHIADRHTSSLQQDALTDFIVEGHFERHLRRVRKRNGERRSTLLRCLTEEFGKEISVTGANAGLHMLVWFANRRNDESHMMVKRAEDVGVGIYPVTPYYSAPPIRAGFVMGYSALEEPQIIKGVKLLAGALK